MELIELVERTDLPVRSRCDSSASRRARSTTGMRGISGVASMRSGIRSRGRGRGGTKSPEKVRAEVIDLALKKTELSARELACHFTDERRYFLSESSVYRILKAADLITSPAYVLMSASDRFKHPTERVHEMWQTDFTYLRVIGWGWYYLSTVMDDFSRFILAYKLGPTMATADVTETLDEALALTGVHSVRVRHRPRLLSDNGPAYVSRTCGITSRAGHDAYPRAPVPPTDAGKIERYHRSMKNVVKLQHYYFPWELEAAVRDFVAYYNTAATTSRSTTANPADVYYGRHHRVCPNGTRSSSSRCNVAKRSTGPQTRPRPRP